MEELIFFFFEVQVAYLNSMVELPYQKHSV